MRSSPRTPWCLVLSLALACAALACSVIGCAKSPPAEPKTSGASSGTIPGSNLLTAAPKLESPPEPKREFRGMFVTTAYNIDWPTRTGMTPPQMQAEIDSTIERAKALNINVIMLQVRSHGDRQHRKTKVKPTQPWARGLNKGADPDPHPDPAQRKYDPLGEWIRACHRNGIELHAWVNPFRLPKKHPVLTSYQAKDTQWYLDWRDVTAQDHVLDVIEELLNYRVSPYGAAFPVPPAPAAKPKMLSMVSMASEEEGIDGIIIDHYYPPPPEPPTTGPATGPSGRSDDAREPITLASAAVAMAAPTMLLATDPARGGPASQPSAFTTDPREAALAQRVRTCTSQNPVENFLCEVFKLVNTKPGAKLGFSPRDDNLDAQQWLAKGLLHYVVPEFYFDDPSWGDKLKPWLDANTFTAAGREKPIVVAGLFTMRAHKPPPRQPAWTPWNAMAICKQVDLSRSVKGTATQNAAGGQAHYSCNALRSPANGGPPANNNVGDFLSTGTQPGQGQYREPRLVPMCVDTGAAPLKPLVTWNSVTGGQWVMPNDPNLNTGVLFWAVWLHDSNGWRPMQVMDRNRMTVVDPSADGIAVKAIDAFNRESPFAVAP